MGYFVIRSRMSNVTPILLPRSKLLTVSRIRHSADIILYCITELLYKLGDGKLRSIWSDFHPESSEVHNDRYIFRSVSIGPILAP